MKHKVLSRGAPSGSSSQLLRFFWLAILVCALAPCAWPQEQPGLDIDWNAGHAVLSLTGQTGLFVTVQSRTNLAQTNAWVTLTNLMMPASTCSWTDPASTAADSRLYRLQATPQLRGVWADAFHNGMQNAAQIDQMISMVLMGNYNAIFAEVLAFHDNPAGSLSHGAYWRSDIVPRSSCVTDSFDPLAYMIERAHDNGIELHAWLVAFRVCQNWPPTNNTFLASHPEYFMVPSSGTGLGPAKVGSDYVLDPGSPAAQEYLVSVVRELVSRYEIDGINWDYIRYTQKDAGYPADLNYTNSGLRRFQRIYSRADIPPSTGDPSWNDFRRRTIDELIRRVRAEIASTANPRQPLRHTGDLVTWGDAPTSFVNSSAYGLFSNWELWLRQGWLDAGVPMCYYREWNPEHASWYRHWVDQCLVWRHSRHMCICVASYLNAMEDTLAQMRYALDRGADGIGSYSYWSTVDANTNGTPENDFGWYPFIRTNLFAAPAPLPAMPWRSPATATEGTLWGQITRAGQPVDNALVQIGTLLTVQTDGNGYYVVTLIPATAGGTSYSLTASVPGSSTTVNGVQVLAGAVRRTDLALDP